MHEVGADVIGVDHRVLDDAIRRLGGTFPSRATSIPALLFAGDEALHRTRSRSSRRAAAPPGTS